MSQNLSTNSSADADLLTRVGIAFTLRLSHTLHAVHIQVVNGAVTLRGIVPTFYDRQLAIEVTRRVAGVLRVNDELIVAGQKQGIPERKVYHARSPEVANASHGAGIEARKRSSASAAVQRFQRSRSLRSLLANAATVLRGLFLASLVLLSVGCGNGKAIKESPVPVHPAQGRITFHGQPIPGAMLTLHPKTAVANVPNPRASVGKDGAFTVSTFTGGDGAPEGEYVLTVVWYKPIKNGPDIQAGPNVIPKKYTVPTSSDLVIKIAVGQNTLQPIQL